jgi:hypothetical protein
VGEVVDSHSFHVGSKIHLNFKGNQILGVQERKVEVPRGIYASPEYSTYQDTYYVQCQVPFLSTIKCYGIFPRRNQLTNDSELSVASVEPPTLNYLVYQCRAPRRLLSRVLGLSTTYVTSLRLRSLLTLLSVWSEHH